MATRFIKPKIDKYIQLYSKYAFVNGTNYTWDLERPIDINENALIQITDRIFGSVPTGEDVEPYTIRMLDVSTQSIVNTENTSGTPQQIYNYGKIIDIGHIKRSIPNNIILEIQPQNMNRISLRVNKGITGDTPIDSAIEFFISLKITEKEPSYIEFGSLNNINIHQ
jgi:hypothetical protein